MDSSIRRCRQEIHRTKSITSQRRLNHQKNTFLIVYPGGAYGTFVQWCLHWFSGNISIDTLPFLTDGSTHKWLGAATGDTLGHNHPRSHETVDYWLNSDVEPLTLRSHLLNDSPPHEHQSLIMQYRDRFQRIILINNHVDCHLLMLHNVLTKTTEMTTSKLFESVIERYCIQFGTSDTVPRWQLREMLSYWHEDWHCYLTDLYQPIHDEKIININPRFLVDNFESCMIGLFDSINLTMTRKSEIARIKDEWLKLQKFTRIDQQCRNIVSATIQNNCMSTQACVSSVIDEAFVLYKLRVDHNLDFQCTGQDQFPCTTCDLKAKLFPYQTHG